MTVVGEREYNPGALFKALGKSREAHITATRTVQHGYQHHVNGSMISTYLTSSFKGRPLDDAAVQRLKLWRGRSDGYINGA